MPAINEVGELFNKGKYFLPQLIASANAMKKAIEYLEPFMQKGNTMEEEKVVVPENNGSLGESIRELRRQGMNVEDIAKIVGTSREEVEFALELEDVLTSQR